MVADRSDFELKSAGGHASVTYDQAPLDNPIGPYTHYSVHALTDEAGAVVEGYIYDAYGRQTVFTDAGSDATWFTSDDTFAADGSSGIANEYMYTGRRWNEEGGNYYFRNRYYDSALGRFISRDPLGHEYGMNQYSWVSANAVNWVDHDGRNGGPTVGLGLNPGEGGGPNEGENSEAADKFKKWFDANQNLSWLAGLPDCPCSIRKLVVKHKFCGWTISTSVYWVNPDARVWTTPSDLLFGYHPGAAACMRSRPQAGSNAGQQCCYDENGALITGGWGAGTPDKTNPGVQQLGPDGHQAQDVAPADWANELGDDYRQKYLQVRPPNNGNNCPENVK